MHSLHKSRQGANGILIPVKKNLQSKFLIVKEMCEQDTSENKKLVICKKNTNLQNLLYIASTSSREGGGN